MQSKAIQKEKRPQRGNNKSKDTDKNSKSKFAGKNKNVKNTGLNFRQIDKSLGEPKKNKKKGKYWKY